MGEGIIWRDWFEWEQPMQEEFMESVHVIQLVEGVKDSWLRKIQHDKNLFNQRGIL